MASFVSVDDEGVGLIVVAKVAAMLSLSCSISTRSFTQVLKKACATGDTIDLAGWAKVWGSYVAQVCG